MAGEFDGEALGADQIDQRIEIVADELGARGRHTYYRIAGPMVRLTEERMVALSDALRHTAEEVAGLSASSTLFHKRVA